jgi:hypothetical protein
VTIRYREIEYALGQGVGGHLWKWSACVAGQVVQGQSHAKACAIAAAEKAIDPCREKGAARAASAVRLKKTYCGGFNSPSSQPDFSDLIGSSAMTVSVCSHFAHSKVRKSRP